MASLLWRRRTPVLLALFIATLAATLVSITCETPNCLTMTGFLALSLLPQGLILLITGLRRIPSAVRRLRSTAHGRVLLRITMVALVFGSGTWMGANGFVAGPTRTTDFQLVREAWDKLLMNYVKADDVDSRQLAYAAITAMADGMGDTEHTTFLTPEEAAWFEEYQRRSGGAGDFEMVEWALAPGTRVAVITIPDFYEGSGDDLASAVRAAKRARAEAFILDLRGNPGGSVGEAHRVASIFLAQGVVLRARDADGEEHELAVDGETLAPDEPLAILVDGETASASEIVAAALQDHHRATIVGWRTFGTGTALEPFPLADGSELWIGNVEWLTPNGRSVWHIGLEPDVLAPMPADGRRIGISQLQTLTAEQLWESADESMLKALMSLAAQLAS